MIVNLHVWADAFGRWHAMVTETGVGNSGAVADLARRRIVSELADREGPGFAPEVVGVTFAGRHSRWGGLTSYYDETNSNERIEAT